MESIRSFRGNHLFLSNFYRDRQPVLFNGKYYLTAEHAFQAAKATSEEAREYVASAPDAREAKKRGREILCRKDWDQVKVQVMVAIVWEKFSENENLKRALLETGNAYLEEGNWWKDTFWGVCNGEGSNILGHILMAVRDGLRRQQK